MYEWAETKRGSQLQRIGATDHCIICGMPALPGVTAFADIQMRDLHLSPQQDPARVSAYVGITIMGVTTKQRPVSQRGEGVVGIVVAGVDVR